MTYAPGTIAALRTELLRWTGLAPTSLGIVGDAAHAARASYHNGKDRILQYDRMATDYSVRTQRDKDGLTNAASALDIGNFARLREMSIWLVAEARNNAPGSSDMREIIYSPDGQTVLRWDRERGYQSAPRTGEADNSHLFHTHISWYRDSEFRTKIGLFARFFEGSGDVESFAVYERRAIVAVKTGAKLYTSSALVANAETITISPGRELVYVGTISTDVRIVAYEPPGAPDSNVSSRAMFVKSTDLGALRFVDDPVPVPVPQPKTYPVTVTVGGKTVNGEVVLP
jgi:hypothetical protein